MKNLNIAKLFGCLSILLIMNLHQAKALDLSDKGSMSIPSDSEMFRDMQNISFELESMYEIWEIKVDIVDQDFNLIAFGNENDDRIEKLINRSDLLTEITGKKIFRLCYETE